MCCSLKHTLSNVQVQLQQKQQNKQQPQHPKKQSWRKGQLQIVRSNTIDFTCILTFLGEPPMSIPVSNAFHAAGECRRQTTGQKSNKLCTISQNVEISCPYLGPLKCIQLSTNMTSIGLVIPEITWEMLEL